MEMEMWKFYLREMIIKIKLKCFMIRIYVPTQGILYVVFLHPILTNVF